MNDLSSSWPFGLGRRGIALFLVGLALVIVALHPFDHTLSMAARNAPDAVRGFFRWLTRWGLSDWILIPSLVAVLISWAISIVTRDRLRLAAREIVAVSGFVFLGVGVPGITATLLKRLIGRGRPETWTEQVGLAFRTNWSAYDYQSFPSGHATTAFAFSLVIAMLWPRLTWPALIIGTLIAMSRVFVGAHYPTDILAGAVLGTFGAYAIRNLFVARGWLFARNADGGIVRKPFTAIRGLLSR
ncbi:phosphatase PAP2 family protein [Devosia sp.]|uniref:phosphatase PAP2 family protein n=1 Tax=Devosia sp. TaxID=1871048 RepID=UPI003A8EDEBC